MAISIGTDQTVRFDGDQFKTFSPDNTPRAETG